MSARAESGEPQTIPAVAFSTHLAPRDAPLGTHCFSQWFRSDFSEGRERFFSAEQYMMFRKALLFEDTENASRILAAKTPLLAYEFGRSLAGFREETWDAEKRGIVFRGNLLKFRQNPALATVLLSTGEAVIAYASASDLVWGTGLSVFEHAGSPALPWPGQNLLGEALMEVRNLLRHGG